MGKIIDLTGMTFGKWTVIRRAEDKMTFDKGRGKFKPKAMWLCRCECGTESIVSGSALRSGKSKQCMNCAKEITKPKPTDDDEVSKKIETKFSRFEYAGGYTGSGGYLYLICKDCGTVFRYNAQITRFSNKAFVMCPKCSKENNDDYEERKRQELATVTDKWEYVCCYLDRDKRRHIIRCVDCGTEKKVKGFSNIPQCKACERKEKAEQKRKNIEANRVKVCVVCGEEFKATRSTGLYCSDRCSKKAYKERHKDILRERYKINKRLREAKARNNGKVDYSITLAKLTKRDKHICKLCGRKVDENDYVYVGDTFIAGNDYPSIDHIIPLSKGGVHQWDNVQLAHRICNSIKCDRE